MIEDFKNAIYQDADNVPRSKLVSYQGFTFPELNFKKFKEN